MLLASGVENTNLALYLSTITGAIVTVFITTFVLFLSRMNKKLNTHDVALAILVKEVNPPNNKSLRDLIFDLQLQLAYLPKGTKPE